MSHVELNVPEIHCDHCKSSIETAVGEISGVAQVDVAVGERSVRVNYDGEHGTYSDVVRTIEDQGYTVTP